MEVDMEQLLVPSGFMSVDEMLSGGCRNPPWLISDSSPTEHFQEAITDLSWHSDQYFFPMNNTDTQHTQSSDPHILFQCPTVNSLVRRLFTFVKNITRAFVFGSAMASLCKSKGMLHKHVIFLFEEYL